MTGKLSAVVWVSHLSSCVETGRVAWSDLTAHEGACIDAFRFAVHDERQRRTAFAELQAKLVSEARTKRPRI